MKFSEAARARRRGLPDRASWVVFARELDRPDCHLHAGSLWLARIFPGPISRSFFASLGLIAGFMIAVAFLPSAASYAAAFWKAPPLFLKGAVFVVIFFLVYFVFSLMGWLLHRSESLLFLKTVNRAGGIAVGLGKGAAIIALIVFFLSEAVLVAQSRRRRIFTASYLVSPLSRFAESLIRLGQTKSSFGRGSGASIVPGRQTPLIFRNDQSGQDLLRFATGLPSSRLFRIM